VERISKRRVLLSFATAATVILVILSTFGTDSSSIASLACSSTKGVVDKAPSDTFTVEMTFKNNGKSEGKWSVNIAFEGESWTWKGTPQTLILKPSDKKTLTWNGDAPEDAAIGSTARLIVYYNDSFVPLDWWIHIVSGSELTITFSTVK
jgi:hypothetical protein